MAWKLISEIPPGRYGNCQILPGAGQGNQTPAELTWRVVASPPDTPPGVAEPESPSESTAVPPHDQHSNPASL